jgi:hypothetical protein
MALRRDEKDPGQPGSTGDRRMAKKSKRSKRHQKGPSGGYAGHPEITGNDYLVMGTLDRPEWRKGMQDPLSIQEMVEHLHDFKEVVTFQRAYV